MPFRNAAVSVTNCIVVIAVTELLGVLRANSCCTMVNGVIELFRSFELCSEFSKIAVSVDLGICVDAWSTMIAQLLAASAHAILSRSRSFSTCSRSAACCWKLSHRPSS